MSAPPAHPRRRSQAPDLLVGDWFQRLSDHTIHQVTNIFEREQRVQLVPSWSPDRYIISYDDLTRGYRKVSS